MTVRDLVGAIGRLGISLGPRPNKTVADFIRWEVERNHVRKVSRGLYVAAHLPESTLRYMRVRVLLYPDRSYERPYTRVFVPDPPPVATVDPNQTRLFL